MAIPSNRLYHFFGKLYLSFSMVSIPFRSSLERSPSQLEIISPMMDIRRLYSRYSSAMLMKISRRILLNMVRNFLWLVMRK